MQAGGQQGALGSCCFGSVSNIGGWRPFNRMNLSSFGIKEHRKGKLSLLNQTFIFL